MRGAGGRALRLLRRRLQLRVLRWKYDFETTSAADFSILVKGALALW